MQATRNRFFLRLLIVLLAVTVGAGVVGDPYFKDTLPTALAAFVKADDDADLTTLHLIVLLITSVAIVASVVGMVGLWWCRRWARWVFTIPALALLLLEGLAGFLDPTTSVSNFIETMLNSAGDMLTGAILALIWLGMSADFDRGSPH